MTLLCHSAPDEIVLASVVFSEQQQFFAAFEKKRLSIRIVQVCYARPLYS